MNLLEKTRRNKGIEIDLNKKQCAVTLERPFIRSLPDDNRRRSLIGRAKENIPSVQLPSLIQIRIARVVWRTDGNKRTVLIYHPIDGKSKTLFFDMKHQFRRVTRDSHCTARAGRHHLIFDSIVFRRRPLISLKLLSRVGMTENWKFKFRYHQLRV